MSAFVRALSITTILMTAWLAPKPTFAQTPPPVVAHDQHVVLDATPPPAEKINWTLNAGSIFNYGNTRSLAASVGTHFGLQVDQFALTADAQFMIGSSYGTITEGTTSREDWIENARNLLLSARADYFVAPDHALFLRAAFRNDPFANLNGRIQVQPGYGVNFYRAESHRFWGEIGYDLTYDRYGIPAAVQGRSRNELIQHSIRGFVGYDNHLSENVTYVTGVEALLDLANTSPINFRLNWTNDLGVKVADDLALSVKWNLFWNTSPPTAANVDLQTTLNLVYTLI